MWPQAANDDYAGDLPRLRQISPDTFAIGYSLIRARPMPRLPGCDSW